MRAVLFDAGNTLVFLDYGRMAAAVGAELGLPLGSDALAAGAPEAARAMEGQRATDRERADAYLEALFRLAGIPAGRMDEVRRCLVRLHGERHLWSSVAPGTREALDRLAAAGLRLGVVSNSDGRVEAALAAADLLDCFDVVIDSTLAGVEKPDPAIFHAALEALDVAPREALYVGDLYDVDVLGARAAGMDAVLFAPGGTPVAGCRAVGSLAELAEYLLPGERAAS
ncbi:MAG TPA: HAD-IA family hydrolase [Gemmatimonadales bacterium]|nr:HAD-IA family hydrolase [Gemmatimonadales bacterium]